MAYLEFLDEQGNRITEEDGSPMEHVFVDDAIFERFEKEAAELGLTAEEYIISHIVETLEN